MHHLPPRPARRFRPLRWALRPALLAAAVVGVLAVAVPMVSGATGSGRVAVDSSSTPGDSPVVMGVDGTPATTATTRGTSSAGRAPAGNPATTATGTSSEPGGGTTAAGAPAAASTPAAPSSVVAPSSTSSSTSESATSSSTSTSPPGGTPSSGADAVEPESSAPSPTSSSAPPPGTGTASVTAAVLAALNTARAGAQCGNLEPDDALTSAALTNSTLMAERGTVSVVDPAGSVAAVASGPADPDAAVTGWLADPADSAQLLDCALTTAGAAEVSGDGGPWWTLFLA